MEKDFKILLGYTKKLYRGVKESVSLNGFKWNCGWYWGGGYIGNKNFHAHFDGAFLNVPDIRGHSLGNFITPWTLVREHGDERYVITKGTNELFATSPTFTNTYRIISNGWSVWEPIETFLDDVPEHIVKNWWRIKDLYKQFYRLREAAEVFRYGGNCTNQGRTEAERNSDIAQKINGHIRDIIIPEIIKALEEPK